MVLKPRTHWRRLCSQAQRETDPKKLDILLTEIDDILCETLDEIADMLNDVEQLLKKME
jgi:hypothetical protein